MAIQFKTPTEQTEYDTLRQKSYAMVALAESLAEFIHETFRKSMIITEIYRSKADQERIYGAGTTKVSPHMFWQAIDIRDWIYTDDEKKQIIEFLKENYDPHNLMREIRAAKSKTVWLHAVGKHGMHFHLQYRGPVVHVFTAGMQITA